MIRDPTGSTTSENLIWPLRLTWAGLWCERLTHAFWPVWTIVAGTLSVLAFGIQDSLPIEAVWIGGIAALGGSLWALVTGLRRFRRPNRGDALARLDAALPGHPIAALTDTQVIGVTDAASLAVWQAHRARMAAQARLARPVAPDLKLSGRDPFALRYVALTALVMALLFGSLWRAGSVVGMSPGDEALANGPVWEGWAQPPLHTGKPALYLNDITQSRLDLPTGTRIQVRLYGEVGALTLTETVSNRTDPPPASDPAQEFEVVQSGTVEIAGPGGRQWKIVATPDSAPSIIATGGISRQAQGEMAQAFTATDDYGVTSGVATIALDLPSVTRSFGLSVDPEPRDAIVLDLPMPITGDRTEVSETLVDDLSKHPFANLPVTITFAATDAMGQTGQSAPLSVILPGRRFFEPLAAALIEMRRDLLWSTANAVRSAQILKAVTHLPEGFIRNERAYLRLRVLLRELDAAAATGLDAARRDEMAEALWDIALLVEEGDLASALERLRRAQDRLDEAIRNGADKSEIDRLMSDLRDALDDYMRQLAEEARRNPDQQMSQDMQGMQMSADQLQQMLDKLQKLMEEGRMAEAAELMEALRNLMENMQVTQGQGGQGGPGSQAMQGLSDLLREQQGLSDESFQELQDQFSGQQGQPGQPGQDQPGQGNRPGTGGDGQLPDNRSLAERQQDLRNRLEGLSQGLPGAGSQAGEEGRQQLDRAGRAMDEAEEALRNKDFSGALDRQAEALEALREGMRNLGEALAQEQGQPDGNGTRDGEAFGRADPGSQRDPLGRSTGEMGRIGSDRNMLQGDDVYRRAQDLLDEIRRRSGDQTRPDSELDYLRRLLNRF
ncbi:MAG: TIGR02302 family protein [Rhodobacter sp.]|nr:TIGR02302 family protein [Rhodobacter sp.]MCA3514894.1 TIGR02302 family protein [Rhodobacter sp.]MCA3518760.1 TIGR02302 family protein [Rhodobacter sp.]MCA3523366.1 TIGR02302 family protein [Rhodobacter sp.]MCA3525724.1 TIGR02302 family protein [Rhodobacter sp.]